MFTYSLYMPKKKRSVLATFELTDGLVLLQAINALVDSVCGYRLTRFLWFVAKG